MWAVPWIFVALGIFYFVGAVALDVQRLAFEGHVTRFEKIYGDDQNYFSRLSSLDIKRWLVQETYNREVLGFKSVDDDSYENLKEAKGSRNNYSNEPPNYIILSNEAYSKRLGYVPVHNRTGKIQT